MSRPAAPKANPEAQPSEGAPVNAQGNASRRLVRVEIDRDLCVGAGMCAGTHPELFRLVPAGHAEVVGERLDEAAAAEAAELCPVSAIQLIYED